MPTKSLKPTGIYIVGGVVARRFRAGWPSYRITFRDGRTSRFLGRACNPVARYFFREIPPAGFLSAFNFSPENRSSLSRIGDTNGRYLRALFYEDFRAKVIEAREKKVSEGEEESGR